MRNAQKFLFILTVFLVFNKVAPVNGLAPLDLGITPSGYTTEFASYSYDEYVDIMVASDANPHDFMLMHDPVDMAVFAYFKGDILVYIELFQFQTAEEAIEEYQAQRDDTGGTSKLYNGPMFQRFISRDRIFQYENYIALVSFDPYNRVEAMDAASTIFEDFIENMVETISVDASSQPADNGDEAIWGIQVGDVIIWEIDDDTLTGTITSGGSSSTANWVPEVEIVQISESGHAVLVKQQKAITEYWYEDEARKVIDIPYEGYSWRTIKNNGLTVTDSKGKESMPLIYPLELNGAPLTELIDETISHLPEKSYDDGVQYYGVFGKTSDGQGFTPVETQWLDITVHRGTGIVSIYDWYYNNNDYGITARSTVSLSDTSFDLSSRTSPVTTLHEFFGSIYVNPDPVEHGSSITVELELFNEDEDPVTGATATAQLEGTQYTLNEEADGLYSKTIDTQGFNLGDYQGTLFIEKAGYESVEGSFVFTVEAEGETPEPEPNPGGGIPAMPWTSILIGLTLFINYLTSRPNKQRLQY